jgi:hypothetical protein
VKRVSTEPDIHFRSDFGFPDVEDSRIHVHRAFAKGILEFVKHRWDIQEYEKRQPPRELYEITERLDSIESKLSACSEANSSTDSGDG